MANFKQVNDAVKSQFPDLDIEVVRGVGYVYFASGDTQLMDIASIMTHPTSTSTEDLTRMVLEDIKAALNKLVVEVPAKRKCYIEKAGRGATIYRDFKTDNELFTVYKSVTGIFASLSHVDELGVRRYRDFDDLAKLDLEVADLLKDREVVKK